MIAVVLVEAFEAIILPRRVKYVYVVRLFDQSTWALWRALGRRLYSHRRRHGFLSIFGPLLLLFVLALWALGLIVGFALLHWSAGTALSAEDGSFFTYLYFSGTAFFTLGYGDLVPTGTPGRMLSVTEAGLGFGFLAALFSYLPVFYQAFSRREVAISLLDARAGSPPTAGELLRRMAAGHGLSSAGPLLAEWERWAAELLESHLSYPILSFYRSQHDNQSWVGALTVVLDTSALLVASIEGTHHYQARLTFAMARHVSVDLALVFETPPRPPEPDRLSEAGLARLRDSLRAAGIPLCDDPEMFHRLAELRGLYEPFVNALAAHFEFTLPLFQPEKPPVDNWQTSAWMRRSPDLSSLPSARGDDEHFD
jgi:hypothetical protein